MRGGVDSEPAAGDSMPRQKRNFLSLRHALFFCGIFLIVFSTFLRADGWRTSGDGRPDELVRNTILEAEAMLNVGDSDFRDCVGRWRRLTQILPLLDDSELKARAKFLRLLWLKRSLESLPRRPVPELEAWLNTQADHIEYCGTECDSWIVNSAEFWALRKEFADLPVADDIAWAAATNRWDPGCEASAACELSAWDASMGEYVRLYPEGKYVSLALDRLADIGRGIQGGKLSTGGESLLPLLRKAIDVVNSTAGGHRHGYFERALESLESAQNAVHKYGGRAPSGQAAPARRPPRVLEDSLDGWMEDWFRPRRFLDLDDYLFVWRGLKAAIPGLEDDNLAAKAKFMRLLCLRRTLALLAGNTGDSRISSAWREEVREFIAAGTVGNKFFWDLCEEYSHLSVADDIAWAAASNPYSNEGVLGPDVLDQLVKLDMTLVRYLDKFPDGKYARLALSSLISFFRRCRGEDPLVSPPHHFEETSYVLENRKRELGRIHETLKRVSGLNEADKTAGQALADFERTFKAYLHPGN